MYKCHWIIQFELETKFFLWTPTFEKTNFERVGLSGTKISPFLTEKGAPTDLTVFSRISPIFHEFLQKFVILW